MSSTSSDQYQSYLPVYDPVPEDPKESREYLTEALKEIANSINAKEIGYYLDEELLSGKQLFPGVPTEQNNQAQTYRQILRKVVDFGAITAGLNTRAHGITFDSNFTLVQLWASATDSVGLIAYPIPSGLGDAITINNTVIAILSTRAFDRCLSVVEYTQEI